MTQTIESTTVQVTADNFVRAESPMYFSTAVRLGGFGKFYHYRDPMPIDDQGVVRANRDTLYSAAVFDLDGGPVTISLPDSGGRFRSMFAVNEDEYALSAIYDAGTIPNCLPITPGWNYMVRLYRPRAEILNGSWHFPEAAPVG
jgi:hypothetical protein